MKVLHTADWHVHDSAYDEINKCLTFLIESAAEEKPDLIIIAADLFESNMVKLDSRSAKLVFFKISQLVNIAPVAIMIGTPSHEGHATEVLRHIKGKYNVWVSDRPEQVYLFDGAITSKQIQAGYEDCVDAVISMVPTPTKQFFQTNSDIQTSDNEIAAAMSGIFAGFGAQAAAFPCPHILAGHFSIGGAFISETQQLVGVDIEISKDQIALARADVVCLGHIHLQQKIKPNIFYSGSIYRKDWGELEEKGFYIHTINKEQLAEAMIHHELLESTFILTPTRKLLKLEADMTLDGAFEEKDIILYTYSPDELKDATLRIEFKVFQDEVDRINHQEIKEFFASAGVLETDIRLIRIPRANVRSQRILSLTTLREKLVERAAIVNEPVTESVLTKADQLESQTPDQIIKSISAG